MGSPVGPTATPAARRRWPSQCVPWFPSSRMASGQPSQDRVQFVDRVDLGDDVDGDLVLVPRRVRDVEPAEGVLAHVGRRLAQHVELAGVLHVVQLVLDAVLAPPLRAQFELGGGPPAGVRFVELVDVHRRHTIAHQDHCSWSRRLFAEGPGGSDRGRVGRRRCRHAHHHLEATRRPHRPDGSRMEVDRPLPLRRPVAPRRRRPRSWPAPPRPRDWRRPAAVPHALRPRRAHAARQGPGRARGGRPPGQGPAPGGRCRPLHLADVGPGSCSRAW